MPADNTVFSVQCGFSFVVMMFCIGMLADNRDPTYYLPILTSLIGYWLPAPRGTSSAPVLPASVRGLPNLMRRRSTATGSLAPAPPEDAELQDMEAGRAGSARSAGSVGSEPDARPS